MKNENKITPVGLKGKEINERMIQLMGIKPINENHTTSVVELTKVGPDGNAYAIVRENHEYYIKMTPKTSGLVTEDFAYIGGLQNKKSEAYPSYAKAIKHLNLKFNSLAESLEKAHKINVFENDNLLKESGFAAFSNYGGSGFSNEGNLEGNTPIFEEEEKEEEEEDVELTEEQQAVQEMLTGDQDELDTDEADDLADLRKGKKVNETKLTIDRALTNMDAIIDGLTEGTVKKKVYTLK
jgi:hypothetical protein